MMLHVEESGQGAPLVMVHGLFGSADNLGAIARILEKDFHLYRLDLRNHGRSPHANTMSFADMAGDLLDVLDELGLEKASLFGHSLGGKAAMELACRHPGRVDKLLVADIAPVAYPARHDAILEGLCNVSLEGVKSRRDADQQLAAYVDEIMVRQFILKSLDREPDGGYRWQLNVPVIADSYDEMRGAVCEGGEHQGPTLFLRGEKSNYIAERNHEEIARKFPHSEIVTIPDASHWLHAEQPQLVAEQVRDFLNR